MEKLDYVRGVRLQLQVFIKVDLVTLPFTNTDKKSAYKLGRQ